MKTRQLFLPLASVLLCIEPLHATTAGFTLTDHLGRAWTNEAVRFLIAGSDLDHAKAGKALVGTDGKSVPYQVLPDARLAFLTELNPFETRTYRFTDAASNAPTDLKIEETADLIRLSNEHTGIAIPKQLKDGAGPIESIRLSSGKWIGGSRLDTKQPVTSYAAEITARGPVFAEVVVQATFSGTNRYSMTFLLQTREPVVLVDETFSLGDKSQFIVSLGRNFAPDSLLWRAGRGVVTAEKIATTDEDPTVFKWQPWSVWGPPHQGKWFGLYSDASADLLMLGARDGDVWVDLRRPRDETISVVRKGDDVVALLPLERGQRRWMVGALPKDASLTEKGKVTAPLPQQYVIKNEFPLDRVKDYVLKWPNATEEHPRLYVTAKDVAKLRQTFKPDPNELARLIKTPVNLYEMDPWIRYFLMTGDAALGKNLTDTTLKWLQDSVDQQLKQESIHWLGQAPHGQTGILTALSLADAILSSDAVTPEQRDRIRAQAAFLGYTFMRSDYWSSAHGFAANPNMTTHVAAYQAAIGCFIASHPMARTWVDLAMQELKDVELDHWSDDNGGWLETPTYAVVSYGYILGSFVATHNSGFNDYLFDPKMKKVIEWLAKISTPPDARLHGWRHMPPIGNTWKLAMCGEFGLLAGLWRERDPEFAAQMQWNFQQHGWYTKQVGGFNAGMAGYRSWYADTNAVAKTPSYASELFPESGVVLRNRYPSERETMLYLIAGNNCQHYDYDSGSITLWGKGRIVADDFGYYGRAPVADHNMVELPLMNNLLVRVKEFAPSARFDYVRAVLDPRAADDEAHLTPFSHIDYVFSVNRGWTRQIAFVKDADPLGPNFFVVCDSLRSPTPATWRLWLTCDKVTLGPQGALVVGKEDVDTDVFFALPTKANLTTEEKTRSTSGYNIEGKYGKWDWMQIGLIAAEEKARRFTAVIYPRLKTEKPPVFTSLADGKAVKVQSTAGTDYVFLSEKPFQFKDADIAFEGTSGAVQLRGNQATLTLGQAGRITFKRKTLKSDKPATEKAQTN